MKVVVTGGSGQLGAAVLERLVAQRQFKKVVSLDLVPPSVPSSRIDWRIADLRDPGLERHVEGADALVHLAALVMRAASVETMHAVNVEGSKAIFEAAARHGVKRIVYASSVAAYGIVPTHPTPIVETTPRKRSEVLTYADTKYDVEEYLDAFERQYPDIAVVRLRPGILFGKRPAHLGERLLSSRVMPIVGDARGPIVWDEDVADAAILALTQDVRGAFNLVAEPSLPGEEIARLSGFRVLRVPASAVSAASRASKALSPLVGERRVDVGWLQAGTMEMIVSSEKARKELGWKPRFPTAADVAIAFGKAMRPSPDTRIRLFLSMVPRLAKRARAQGDVPSDAGTMKLAVHLDITGPGGGDFALTLDRGAVTLKRGIPRPPDSTVVLSDETFLELLAGKLDAGTAGMTGRIRVRGEPMGSLVLSGMISGFRKATSAPGMQGRIARRFAEWLEPGADR